MSHKTLGARLGLVLPAVLLGAQRQLANLNAEQIDLSIELMQALGGGFQGETLAAAGPSPAPATRNQ